MLCYNCFRKFKPHEVWFRCSNANVQNQTEACPLVEDQKTKEMARHAFPVHGIRESILTLCRNPLHSDCPRCGVRSTRRLCPHCHWELFPGYGQLPEFVTAVVGNTASGKSHYFTVMVEKELKVQDVGKALVTLADGASERVWLTFYYNPLFQNHMAIPPTAAELKQKLRIIYHFSIRTRRHTNVFFDIAGENLMKIGEQEETNETRYLWVSSGIIFLVNPRDIPAWGPFLEGGFLGGVPPNLLLGRLVRELRKNKELGPNQKIKIPLAVCIGQFDRFYQQRDRLGLSDNLFDSTAGPVRAGKMDAASIDAESMVVKDFLLNTGGPVCSQIVMQADEDFVDARFFAVSALGQSPGLNQEVPEVRPNRVAAPMFWLMSRVGAVKTGAVKD